MGPRVVPISCAPFWGRSFGARRQKNGPKESHDTCFCPLGRKQVQTKPNGERGAQRGKQVVLETDKHDTFALYFANMKSSLTLISRFKMFSSPFSLPPFTLHSSHSPPFCSSPNGRHICQESRKSARNAMRVCDLFAARLSFCSPFLLLSLPLFLRSSHSLARLNLGSPLAQTAWANSKLQKGRTNSMLRLKINEQPSRWLLVLSLSGTVFRSFGSILPLCAILRSVLGPSF